MAGDVAKPIIPKGKMVYTEYPASISDRNFLTRLAWCFGLIEP